MSTCYINCAFCDEEIGSAHEMVIMAEGPEGITMAAHPGCYEEHDRSAIAERQVMEAESRIDRERESFADWDSL